MSEDALKRVVHFVSDPGDELAEGRQSFGLGKALPLTKDFFEQQHVLEAYRQLSREFVRLNEKARFVRESRALDHERSQRAAPPSKRRDEDGLIAMAKDLGVLQAQTSSGRSFRVLGADSG